MRDFLRLSLRERKSLAQIEPISKSESSRGKFGLKMAW